MDGIPQILAMPLGSSVRPFSSPNWIFELKHDGFRGLAYVHKGQCQLLSRKGHRFTGFDPLCQAIAESMEQKTAILDGEIVCLDAQHRRSVFHDLLSHLSKPYFYAFDLLWLNGQDWRDKPLLERKERLVKLLRGQHGRVRYVDHLEEQGEELYRMACARDLEGIVAKLKTGRYVSERQSSTWVKINNRDYSQKEGRHQMITMVGERLPFL